MTALPIDGHYTRLEATAYAKRIRNPMKRAYAEAWIRYRFDGAPEPERGQLSYMAAQGVRLTIGFPTREVRP